MTWTYSGDPASSPGDATRFWLGDTTETTPQLSDEELAYLLTQAGGKPLQAAILGCYALASKYASQVDFAVESELRVDLSQRAAAYAQRARDLERQAQQPGVAGAWAPQPYAGGVSQGDMQTREQDSDRVPPSFHVGQFEDGTWRQAPGPEEEP